MTDQDAAAPPETVDQLRARWRPVKESFPKEEQNEGICARMYRSFSWLARAEQLAESEGDASADDQLILTWTGLNSLYGRWNELERTPERDLSSLERFCDLLFRLDKEEERLVKLLEEQRPAVLAVLDNQFLSKQFWNAPDLQNANRKTRERLKAGGWYYDGSHRVLLEKVLLNVYYMRCQMVHGAATRGSSLNRDTLGACLRIIRLLVPTMLRIIIEHGKDEDWGPVCYPVVK
jgi:hypothetical protein